MKMQLDDLPVPGDYWKAPTPHQHGDKDAQQIHTAVGYLLSTWEVLEEMFAFLFQHFVGGSQAAARAYGSIISNTGRQNALREAGEFYFRTTSGKEEMSRRFTRLMNHFQVAGTRRNEIAHGIVADFRVQKVHRGYFLAPPSYNSSKTQLLPMPTLKKIQADQFSVFGHSYRYTSADILEIRGRISRFHQAVAEYLQNLTPTR